MPQMYNLGKNRNPRLVCVTSFQPLETVVMFPSKFPENFCDFCWIVTSVGSLMSPICVASQVLRLREKQRHLRIFHYEIS